MRTWRNVKIITLVIAIFWGNKTSVFAQGYDYQAHERSISVGVGYGYMFSDAAATLKSQGLLKDFVQQDAGTIYTIEYRKYLMAGVAYVLNLGVQKYQGSHDYTRHMRDYQYSSTIGEVSALVNLDIFSFFSAQRIPMDTYLVGGVGLMGAKLSDQSFSPASGRPNMGDKLAKKGGGFNFIAGFGLRFPIVSFIDLRLEGKYYIGYSDYLDGYSPAASKHPDLIVEGVVKISYHLPDKTFER
ncbi:MAG: hypothetical protein H6Q17_671 [Bacteroidetes bacterium]|jgi:hypothetical protein|nr:hypothetical protein [Bacteroidota bacterium]